MELFFGGNTTTRSVSILRGTINFEENMYNEQCPLSAQIGLSAFGNRHFGATGTKLEMNASSLSLSFSPPTILNF